MACHFIDQNASQRCPIGRARARIGTNDCEHEHRFTEHEHGLTEHEHGLTEHEHGLTEHEHRCRFVGTGDWRGVSNPSLILTHTASY